MSGAAVVAVVVPDDNGLRRPLLMNPGAGGDPGNPATVTFFALESARQLDENRNDWKLKPCRTVGCQNGVLWVILGLTVIFSAESGKVLDDPPGWYKLVAMVLGAIMVVRGARVSVRSCWSSSAPPIGSESESASAPDGWVG